MFTAEKLLFVLIAHQKSLIKTSQFLQGTFHWEG